MKMITKLLNIALVIFIAGCNQTTNKSTNESTPSPVKSEVNPSITENPDYKQLIGDYLRSDGIYTLKIISISEDGKIDAAYFNPNPINVGSAKWVFKDNSFYITVELRDVNYPGSTYTLQYFPEKQELAGNYYQATQQQNYDVVFIRQK